MINVDGRELDATVVPGTDPPIVFVNAKGTVMTTWAPVLPLLECDSQTIRYDRSGMGASEARPAEARYGPYSMLATELHTLLDNLDVTAPAVLVGHSIGSCVVRMFAHAHPDRVAGMVHVDGSVPHLIFLPGDNEDGDRLDGDRADSTEIDAEVGREEVAAAWLPRVPSVVLVKTPGWHTWPHNPNMDQLWQYNQQILAQQTGAALIIAKHASHHIQREAPELVTFAIESVVATVQRGEQQVEPTASAVHHANGILIY